MRPYYGKIKEGIPWKGSEGKSPEEASLTLMVNKDTSIKSKNKIKKKGKKNETICCSLSLSIRQRRSSQLPKSKD